MKKASADLTAVLAVDFRTGIGRGKTSLIS
jgi:hypothetical protein